MHAIKTHFYAKIHLKNAQDLFILITINKFIFFLYISGLEWNHTDLYKNYVSLFLKWYPFYIHLFTLERLKA